MLFIKRGKFEGERKPWLFQYSRTSVSSATDSEGKALRISFYRSRIEFCAA